MIKSKEHLKKIVFKMIMLIIVIVILKSLIEFMITSFNNLQLYLSLLKMKNHDGKFNLIQYNRKYLDYVFKVDVNLDLNPQNANSFSSKFDFSLENQVDQVKSVKKLDINIFDLKKPLEPKEIYDPILCRNSTINHVTTTICVHDLQKDIFVSYSIWKWGLWEFLILKPFMEYIMKTPDILIIDIGANIGQYTLFAAKLGLNVISIEPFYDNIIRIHKAANIQSIQDKITLVANAVSNKTGEIKLLEYNPTNIGAQKLIDIKLNENNKKDSKYVVKTITFDDIIHLIPLKKNGEKYKRGIIKIDIEGYEPYAFERAKNLFDQIEICIIYMEFGSLPSNYKLYDSTKKMINFLFERNFSPFDEQERILDKKSWPSWPVDLVWKKPCY